MQQPNLLIIGAGGVGAVAAKKAVEFRAHFNRVVLASRSGAKPRAIAMDAQERWARPREPMLIQTRQVDARNLRDTVDLLKDASADIVVNLASPYCNETIMDACIETRCHYIDTAVAEKEHVENAPPPWYANIEWPRREDFARRDLTALLGIGFDPGVVNVFCAYAKKHYFDEIESIDIIDVNGGDHGRYFATNFDAETNLREIREDAIYWNNGEFARLSRHTRSREVTLPIIGTHKVYSMGHDELHSLPKSFPEAKRIEFWMGFSEQYLEVFNVLDRLNLLSSASIDVDGSTIEPIKVVKAVLPDPATLAAGYQGQVCIGCEIYGTKNGNRKRVFLYSTCSHETCYREVGSQAISYTTGVPPIAAAILLARGDWQARDMVNVEQLDPDPFLDVMPQLGISWTAQELPLDQSWPFEQNWEARRRRKSQSRSGR